jgi:catechol 2,3-dioxygenase-like lactoylglutathione lyase family enzyme
VDEVARPLDSCTKKSQFQGSNVDMLPIKGLYEVAIRVKDPARAEAFYKDVLGLKEGLRDERRNWLFLYAGGDAGMVVLQEDKGEWPTQHFAFTVNELDIRQAAEMLRSRGFQFLSWFITSG